MDKDKLSELGLDIYKLIHLYLGENEVLTINKEDLVDEIVELYKSIFSKN